MKKLIRAFPVTAICVALLGGVALWGAFNWSMDVANTESFCISCHEMEVNVYAEYKKTIHFENRTGVKATCPDCHVPKQWQHMVVRKIQASSELFHWALGTIDTREKFLQRRTKLADHVWTVMKETDSRECKNCHSMNSMAPKKQKTPASVMHSFAPAWGMTCIDCHKGIAHSLPAGFSNEAMLGDVHERLEKDEVECQICHTGMARAPIGEEW